MITITALDVLAAGAAHMRDRAATYDAADKGGERSMAATVAAFNAITGKDLSEEQGWLLMVLLKVVRSQAGQFKLDNYEDGAAYFALMAEAAAVERAGAQVAETKTQAADTELRTVGADGSPSDGFISAHGRVPNHVNWIAHDPTGKIFGYDFMPIFSGGEWKFPGCRVELGTAFAIKKVRAAHRYLWVRGGVFESEDGSPNATAWFRYIKAEHETQPYLGPAVRPRYGKPGVTDGSVLGACQLGPRAKAGLPPLRELTDDSGVIADDTTRRTLTEAERVASKTVIVGHQPPCHGMTGDQVAAALNKGSGYRESFCESLLEHNRQVNQILGGIHQGNTP